MVYFLSFNLGSSLKGRIGNLNTSEAKVVEVAGAQQETTSWDSFQVEVLMVLDSRAKVMNREEAYTFYDVRQLIRFSGCENVIIKTYNVVYDEATEEVHCICRSFEFRGILCCHALCVFQERDIMYIPPQYIMNRWRKEFKRAYQRERGMEELDATVSTIFDRYDVILTKCTRIADFGSQTMNKFNIVVDTIKKLRGLLIDMPDEEDTDPIPTFAHSDISKCTVKNPNRQIKGKASCE
ncbi:hypothetical protein Syun_009555 [Stephania yunnanensis]|uniref:Protein FAR1-RELATED SEQUENCE n=1 Tax=Stephania yunnanensis TaxID=152371 RepID=A0AAP0KEQ3_9MAGN